MLNCSGRIYPNLRSIIFVFRQKIINDNHTRAGKLSHLAILTGLALGTLPLLVFAHPSLPVNGNIVVGQGKMDVNNTTLTITQQSDKLAINWGSFDIAQGNNVIYNQPGQQSIALNQVLGRDASQIYGNLKANGQVFYLIRMAFYLVKVRKLMSVV